MRPVGSVIATGQAPWIPSAHRMELLRADADPDGGAPVTAAFVMTFDTRSRLLLTHVNLPGRGWDLPGGHLDADEQPVAAAAREVREETGFVIDAKALKLIGWQRFILLEEPPDWYPYPFPVSYMLMFMTRTDGPGPPVQPPDGSECGPAEWCTLTEVAERCAVASWLPFVGSVASELG